MEPVLIEQFFLGCLAHASYIVASEGVAAVIDPQRDVDLYLDFALHYRLGAPEPAQVPKELSPHPYRT